MRSPRPIVAEPDEDRCRCAACGLRFVDTNSFTRHRTGPYTARRCKRPDEMRRAWRTDDGGGMRYGSEAHR